MTLRSLLFDAASTWARAESATGMVRETASEATTLADAAGAMSNRGLSSGAADRLREDVQRMRADIERLLMIAEALWTMVQEQHGYTDDELFRRITEIDLADGRADGRVAPSPPALCPACGKRVSRRHPLCVYCGKPMVTDPFAR